MKLAEQWREIERGLPDGWSDARLVLRVEDAGKCDRAAALLGPLMPGVRGATIRFYAARRGAGPGPDRVRRALQRLDVERIAGTLELVAAGEPTPVVEPQKESLAETWDALVAGLPADWSDLYAEVELRSTDYLERGALLMAPLNPARYGGKPGFRFRAARRFGYGASPGMVHRCLERLDEEEIRGTVSVLWALSDTRPVATQGPVWYFGGKSV